MTNKTNVTVPPELWSNDNNIEIFEVLPKKYFEETAEKIGLDKCPDIKQLIEYIDNSESILDIGAGWGRVLKYLVKMDFRGKIYAIERSKQFFSDLKKEFGSQVNLLLGDIRTIPLPHNMQLILWMWAGIAEFPEQEQRQIFIRLVSVLSKGGHLIIETNPIFDKPSPESKLKMTTLKGQHGIVQEQTTNALYYYYMPSTEQLKEYGKQANIKNMLCIPYQTDKGLRRALHIFKK